MKEMFRKLFIALLFGLHILSINSYAAVTNETVSAIKTELTEARTEKKELTEEAKKLREENKKYREKYQEYKKSVKKDVTEKNNERYAKIEELRKQIKDRGNERKELNKNMPRASRSDVKRPKLTEEEKAAKKEVNKAANKLLTKEERQAKREANLENRAKTLGEKTDIVDKQNETKKDIIEILKEENAIWKQIVALIG